MILLQNSKTPTIFGDSWDGKVKSEPLRKFTPTPSDSVPTVQYTVVRDSQHDTSNDTNSIAVPTEQNFYRQVDTCKLPKFSESIY